MTTGIDEKEIARLRAEHPTMKSKDAWELLPALLDEVERLRAQHLDNCEERDTLEHRAEKAERDRDEARRLWEGRIDQTREKNAEIVTLRARAEKAERELAEWRSKNPSDDLWRVRMEQAERERDEARAQAAGLIAAWDGCDPVSAPATSACVMSLAVLATEARGRDILDALAKAEAALRGIGDEAAERTLRRAFRKDLCDAVAAALAALRALGLRGEP